MKRMRCLKVSYNTPENGNAYCGVQHGYFQLGVLDRGKISKFFHQGARVPEKKTKMIRIMVLVGVKHTQILI